MVIRRYKLNKTLALPRNAKPVFSYEINAIEYMWCIVDPKSKIIKQNLEKLYRSNVSLFDDYTIQGNLHCELVTRTMIEIPKGCQILGVFCKRDILFLDMLGNPDIPHERRYFKAFADNEDLPDINIIYCGTSIDRAGSAYHIFECESEEDFDVF